MRLSLRGGERALPGQIPLTLVRVVERPRTVRLHFAEGLAGDMGVAEFAALPQSKFWQAEIAPNAMRALS